MQKSWRSKLSIISSVIFLAMVAPSSPAGAQSSEDSDFPIRLGPIEAFGSEAEAQRHCRDDAVVWADKRTTYFYPKILRQYGNTPDGVYTCLKQAKQADYWGIGSMEGLEGAGREFPIDTCASCF